MSVNKELSNYGPVTRMREKAEALRESLQESMTTNSPKELSEDSKTAGKGGRAAAGSSASSSGAGKRSPVIRSGEELRTRALGKHGLPPRAAAGPVRAPHNMAGSGGRMTTEELESYSRALEGENVTLKQEMHTTKDQVELLEEDAQRRQDSYLRRERKYRLDIKRLQSNLDRAKMDLESGGGGKGAPAMTVVRDLHSQVLSMVDQLGKKNDANGEVEESDALRNFRVRLNDVEEEIKAERDRSDDGRAEWIEKTVQLRKELEAMQETAIRLDQQYKLAKEECDMLRTQYKAQEDDREYLVRQVIFLRKENKRQKEELDEMKGAPRMQMVTPRSEGASGGILEGEEEGEADEDAAPSSGAKFITQDAGGLISEEESMRYEVIVQKLQKIIEGERRRTRQARSAHMQEVASRTELQQFLRECVDDVRQQVQDAMQEDEKDPPRIAGTPGPGGGGGARPMSATRPMSAKRPMSALNPPRLVGGNSGNTRPTSAVDRVTSADARRAIMQGGLAVGVQDLTSNDKEKVLEALLAKERVLQLLYQKTFPDFLESSASKLMMDRSASEKASGKLSSTATPRPTSGLPKSNGGRDWALDVDAMLAEFMGVPKQQGASSGLSSRRKK